MDKYKINFIFNKEKDINAVLNNLTEDNKVNNKKELEIITNDIKQINDNLDTIYIDKLNKRITEEQFERVKIKLKIFSCLLNFINFMKIKKNYGIY